MIAYGHAPACSVLHRRRAAELLPGRRAARRHAAGGEPADPVAREAARPAAARPFGAARRADRGRPPALPSAQRLLALEEQLLAELGEEVEGELTGRLEIGASTGPGGTVLPVALAEFQQLHPGVHVALSVSDTQRVIEQVARREVELGVVGAVAPPPRRRLRAVLPRRGRARRSARAPLRRPQGDARRAEGRAARPDAGGRRRAAGDRRRAPRDRPAPPRFQRAARARPAGVGAERRARRATA